MESEKDLKVKKRKDQKYKVKDHILLPFDLYTRIYWIARLINSLAKPHEKLRVLDVGGRDGRLAEFLDPTIEVTILDIRESHLSEKNYFVGDILDPPFEEGSFDVVTSCELLEHIKAEDRDLALRKMFFLTKNYLVLSAPFYSKEVSQAETMVNDFYRKLNGKDHPWLKEHLETPLPSRKQLEGFLRKNNYSFRVITSNNVNNWLLMQLFTFSSKFGPEVDLFNNVVAFYNTNFRSLGDSLEPTYRRIYLAAKEGKKPSGKTKEKLNPYLFNQLLKGIFDALASSSVRLETLNSELANNLKNLNQAKEQEILEIKKLLSQKDNELKSIYNSRSWKLANIVRKTKKLTNGLIKNKNGS